MARLISIMTLKNGSLVNKNTMESAMMRLKESVTNKDYKENYTEALELVVSLYKSSLTSITNSYAENQILGGATLIDLISKHFNGVMTRGIYVLILQDVLDVLTKREYLTDFSRYLEIAEDYDDIQLKEFEFGSKLSVFNTKTDLKLNTRVKLTATEELNILLNKLGIEGMYYFYKALFKVIAIAK